MARSLNESAIKPINPFAVIAILVGAIVFLLLTGWLSFSLRKCSADKKCSFWEWFNSGPVTWRSVGLGFGTGIAFGGIDNALLFFGISALDSVFQRLPGGLSPVVNAAYGNAFSSSISAFGAAFIGQAIADISGQNSTTLWAESIGVFVGGLIGIIIPSLILSTFTKLKNKD